MATATKKKTTTSETVVGQAATFVDRGLKAIKDAIANLESLSSTTEDKQHEIAELESKISSLSAEYAEKLRAFKVQTDLDMKSYTIAAIQTVAASHGKTVVDSDQYNTLKKDYESLKADFVANVTKEVNIKVGVINNDYVQKEALRQAEAKATAASTAAELASAKSQVDFYRNQVDALMKQLDSERQAGIERAKAASIGSVNVNSGSK